MPLDLSCIDIECQNRIRVQRITWSPQCRRPRCGLSCPKVDETQFRVITNRPPRQSTHRRDFTFSPRFVLGVARFRNGIRCPEMLARLNVVCHDKPTGTLIAPGEPEHDFAIGN